MCIEFNQRQPTASFFASRSFADRRNPKDIVHTIAYQLAAHHVVVQSAIAEVLQKWELIDVTTKPLSEQVERFITNPLRTLNESTTPILLVIDVLNEYEIIDSREGGQLILLLAAAIKRLSVKAKLLITGREEPKIVEMFHQLNVDTKKNSVRLQNIEDSIMKKDLKAYFTYHFRRICKSRGLKDTEGWPSEADLDLLVDLTGKLFVFAALLIRIVGADRADPKDQLEEFLRPLSSPSSSGSAFKKLDELYLDVLI